MRDWLIACCLLLAWSAYGADYYVDVDSRGGRCDDAGPGALERPWRTLSRAASGQEPCPKPGDTIWIRGGLYKEQVSLRAGGTPDQPLTFRAFSDEKSVLDGEGRRQYGIRLPKEGDADYVVIEGLVLKNFGSGGVGIAANGRTGVTIRGVEVSDAGTGVMFGGCTKCRLLESNVHSCKGNNVLVDSACSELVIADNHIHHSGSHSLSIYAPGDGVRGQGVVVSIEPHGPGLARFTTEKLELNKVRDGTLRGQNDTGSEPNPSLILLFADRNPEPDGRPLPGGTVHMQDGHDWFVLRNNPDWGGKPYSPDGKTGLFEIGRADLEALSRAKFVYVAHTFSPSVANRDIQILRNEVDHGGVQGIWVQRAEGVLIQGNRTHHNGATGIQIESLCRRIWLDGNISYANCTAYSHETGIWLDETVDAVVQNNILYENQKGMGVTQCEWVLVRRNVIRHNQAQHVTQNREGCWGNAGGFWYSGGRHSHLGAPVGAVFSHVKVWDLASGANRVRLKGRSFCDDAGPFLGLGASYFQALRHAKYDRARLKSNLALLTSKGFNYVRILSMVSWEGLEIAPVSFTNRAGHVVQAWPDYWQQFRDVLDLAAQHGLRVEVTIFADAQYVMPDKSTRQAHLDGILTNIAGRERQILHLEVANEAWQNGFPGSQGIADLRAFSRYLADRTSVPVAITSNGDTSDRGLIALYSGSGADLATVHFSRDTRTVEGGWLPVRDPYRLGNLPGVPPVSSNEPIGPGSSVSSETDPIKLCAAAVFAYLSNLPAYVYHSRAGVYGYVNSYPHTGDEVRFENTAGINAYQFIRQILPPDLASWVRNDGLEPSAPFTVFCNDQSNRYWPDVSRPTDGCDRNIGSAKGREFVCFPMGVLGGGVILQARRPVQFQVFNPLSGVVVSSLTLNAGNRFTLAQGPGAYILKGIFLDMNPPPGPDGQ